jgi:hypothetical protein
MVTAFLMAYDVEERQKQAYGRIGKKVLVLLLTSSE